MQTKGTHSNETESYAYSQKVKLCKNPIASSQTSAFKWFHLDLGDLVVVIHNAYNWTPPSSHQISLNTGSQHRAYTYVLYVYGSEYHTHTDSNG